MIWTSVIFYSVATSASGDDALTAVRTVTTEYRIAIVIGIARVRWPVG
jgi:hypothetical protein